ncbi:MAG: DegT/DnrJ/EryC1/StrS family aminotransferase [Pseudomonadota bacterium]
MRRPGESEPPALKWPYFSEDDIAAAVAALRSGRVNAWTGQGCEGLERAFARYCAAPYALAVANGTLALELAFHALDLPAGTEVVVPPRTHISTVTSVIRAGLVPVFADVDRDTQCVSAQTVSAVITPRTGAVVVVHLGGWPADMAPLMALAEQHGLAVIEDASQAHGASLDGQRVGGFGHLAAFSFCQDKILTTAGEGGLLLLRDREHFERAWSMRDHGKHRERTLAGHDGQAFRWLHDEVGSNWRLNDMAAAVGLSQLGRIEQMLARRRDIAQAFADALSDVPELRVVQPADGVAPAWYRFYAFVRTDTDAFQPSQRRSLWLSALGQRGVACGVGSCPEVYRERAIADLGLAPRRPLPVARELGETGIALNLHSNMSDDAVAHICDALRDAARAVAAIGSNNATLARAGGEGGPGQ